MATLLVLGGDGYLGWPLALTLAARRPDARVVIVDNLARRRLVAEVGADSITPIAAPEARLAAYRRRFGRGNLGLVELDVAAPELDALIAELRPDTIYHLAQQASAPYSMADVGRAVHTLVNNEVGNMRLLWAVRAHVPGAHVVKLGSFGEYAHCGLDIPEGYFVPEHRGRRAARPVPFPRESDDIYHVSKINDTNYISLACRKWGLRITDVMQCTTFGAGVRLAEGDAELDTRLDYDAVFGTVVNRFAAQVASGHPITVYGTGHQRTGLIEIDDAIGSLAALAERPPAPGEHRVINHVTERDFSVNEIAAAILRVAAERGLRGEVSRAHDPRGELAERKADHAIAADYVAATLRATPFEAALARLFDAVLRHKARVDPALFPPQVAWRPLAP